MEVHLTIRGGGKLGVRKSIQKTNKSEEYKNFALDTSKGVSEVVKKSVLHTLQSTAYIYIIIHIFIFSPTNTHIPI